MVSVRHVNVAGRLISRDDWNNAEHFVTGTPTKWLGFDDNGKLEEKNPPSSANPAIADVTGLQAALDAKAAIGAAPTLTTVEKDLGTAQRTGSFTITGSGMTTGKPVFIQQAVGPYTGKGTLADEAEMDQISLSGSVTSATTITVYWTAQRPVSGNFKFDYFIGA